MPSPSFRPCFSASCSLYWLPVDLRTHARTHARRAGRAARDQGEGCGFGGQCGPFPGYVQLDRRPSGCIRAPEHGHGRRSGGRQQAGETKHPRIAAKRSRLYLYVPCSCFPFMLRILQSINQIISRPLSQIGVSLSLHGTHKEKRQHWTEIESANPSAKIDSVYSLVMAN